LKWGLASASSPLWSGCCRKTNTPVAVAGAVPDPAIDIHCHVFNAQDLPVEGFVVESILLPALKNGGLAHVADLLVKKLSALLETFAPDAPTEQAYLDGPGHWDPAAEFDRQTLRFFADATAGSPPGSAASAELKNHAQFPALVSALMDSLQPGARAYLESMADPPPVTLTPDDILGPTELGRELAHYLGWARQMCNYRIRNIDRLLQLFGPERQGPGILAPSLVDFHRWLGVDPLTVDDSRQPRVCVDQQVALMSRIVTQRPNVLPFVPIDPRRDWKDSHALLDACFSDTSPNGFVGVKLYPPMGFAPWNNDHIRRCYADDPRARELQQTVETNLRALYDYCVSNDVPIMSHTTSTNATQLSRAGKTYLPSHWGDVLKIYPRLRLNLAHFGGVGAFTTDPMNAEHAAVGQLLEDYEHVFADMADDTEAQDPDFRDRFRGAFATYAATYHAFPSKFMYGSDWDILGSEFGFETFLDDWAATFSGMKDPGARDGDAVQALRDKFFFTNAIAFLGLSEKGNKNATRLMKFHGQDAAPRWLALATNGAQ